MRRWLLGFILAGVVGVIANRAGAQGSWYYCDAAHAYYPYVATCPGGWRAVAPYDYRRSQQSQSASPPQTTSPKWVAPAPTTSSQSDVQPSATYQQGQADRQAWETWFASLSGDYRAGAEWWAGQRSLPHPGLCDASPSSTGHDWTAGCFAAQEKLSPWDVRRKTEPEYRLGWNNPAPVAAAVPEVANSPPRPEQVTPTAPSTEITENRVQGWLGLRVQDVTPAIAESLGLAEVKGVLVASLTPGGAAERVGIRAGDVIESYSGADINNPRDLLAAVAATPTGQSVYVTVWRAGRNVTLTPTIRSEAENSDGWSVGTTARHSSENEIPIQRPAQVTHTDNDAAGPAAILRGFLIIAVVIAISIYFLPTIVGAKRGLSSSGALFFVNFILGWTLIGWLLCFLWAATGATRAQDEFYRRGGSLRK